jgi:hypothetical protein
MAILAAGERDSHPPRIRLVIASPKEHGYERVKLITVNQRTGPNMPGHAMHKPMNEAAQARENCLFVVPRSTGRAGHRLW